MRTLIIAGDETHASAIRKQIICRERTVVVIALGAIPAQRFDLILVTDLYQRMAYFNDEEAAGQMTRWFDECVRCRLSGPEAMLIKL